MGMNSLVMKSLRIMLLSATILVSTNAIEYSLKQATHSKALSLWDKIRRSQGITKNRNIGGMINGYLPVWIISEQADSLGGDDNTIKRDIENVIKYAHLKLKPDFEDMEQKYFERVAMRTKLATDYHSTIQRYTEMSKRVKKYFSNFAPTVTKIGFDVKAFKGSKYSTLWRLEWRSPPTATVLALWKGDTKSLAPGVKLEFTKLFNNTTWLTRSLVIPMINEYQNRDDQRVFDRVDEHLGKRSSSTIRSNSGKRKQATSSAKLRKMADRAARGPFRKGDRVTVVGGKALYANERGTLEEWLPAGFNLGNEVLKRGEWGVNLDNGDQKIFLPEFLEKSPTAKRTPRPPSTPKPIRAPQTPSGPMPKRKFEFKKRVPQSPDHAPKVGRKKHRYPRAHPVNPPTCSLYARHPQCVGCARCA